MRIARGRRYAVLLSLIFALTLCALYLLSFPLHARADGGAPNLAYVSGTSPGISVIDVGQAKVTRTMAVVGDPRTILLSADGSTLYVTQPSLGQVSLLAAKTGQIICTAHPGGTPTLLALDPNTATLYAAGSGSSNVSALDSGNCRLKHTFETGSPVYGLAITLPGVGIVHATGGQLWVSGTQSLTIFDDRAGKLLAHVPLAAGPQYLSIPPGGATVYVTTRQGSVEAVDITTRNMRQLLTGGSFGTMDFDELSGEVYVPDAQHNLLDVLAPVNLGVAALPAEPNRVIHLDYSPTSVAITNDGQLGFVALRGGKVAMIDLLERQVVYTVSVTGTPRFIITGLFPPNFLPTPTRTASTTVSVLKGTSTNILSKIVLPALLIVILALVLFLTWQVRIFLKSSTKSKYRR
ncbi:MAG TPA: YncE family protein [Ktedonobacteraceae bacterium]